MDGKTTQKIEVSKVAPYYHSEVCPVCNGFGTVKHGAKECDGCKGKCYILVPNYKE